MNDLFVPQTVHPRGMMSCTVRFRFDAQVKLKVLQTNSKPYFDYHDPNEMRIY